MGKKHCEAMRTFQWGRLWGEDILKECRVLKKAGLTAGGKKLRDAMRTFERGHFATDVQ